MAPIMLIGEAPGANESKTGQPFTGQSGQWMQAQLDALEISHLVYITNSARCRPPENRKPTPQEIAACRPYLHGELLIVQPKVIVCLGRTAIEALSLRGATRGKVYEYSALGAVKWPVLFTWHPAYCTRTKIGSQSQVEFIRTLIRAKEISCF